MPIIILDGNRYVTKHISMIGNVKIDHEGTGKFYFPFVCGGVTFSFSDCDRIVVENRWADMVCRVTYCSLGG